MNKILLVDDDSELLRGLTVRLQAAGYAVVTASSGIAAIEVATQEKPDLVILDIMMPDAHGFKVMERLRAKRSLAHIPIIILSGRNPEPFERDAHRAGACAFFRKPADNDKLLAAIEHALADETPVT